MRTDDVELLARERSDRLRRRRVLGDEVVSARAFDARDEARTPVDKRLPEVGGISVASMSPRARTLDTRDVRLQGRRVGRVFLAMEHLAVGRDDGQHALGAATAEPISRLEVQSELREKPSLSRRQDDGPVVARVEHDGEARLRVNAEAEAVRDAPALAEARHVLASIRRQARGDLEVRHRERSRVEELAHEERPERAERVHDVAERGRHAEGEEALGRRALRVVAQRNHPEQMGAAEDRGA